MKLPNHGQNPEEVEMIEGMLENLRGKIYRKAAFLNLAEKEKGIEQVIDIQEIDELRADLEVLLQMSGLAKADIKKQLVDWAQNANAISDEKARKYALLIIDNLYSWGI